MAKRKAAQSAADVEIDMQEVQASSQPIWEKNPNLLLYIVGGILLVLAAWWGYKTLVVEPQQKEAEAAMWQAQLQFDRDSFQMALENPGGGYDGFLSIIDKYGSTKAGNLAKYYAGVCYLNMEDFDKATQYMEDFSPEGSLLPVMKYGVLGDCYAEKGDMGKALKFYSKAADEDGNAILSAHYLKKAGLLQEFQGDKAGAKASYERLKKEFANSGSADWRDIDKYISRVSQ
ncbi:MAG: tetratricopeptide repeat protein [Lewinellaceae bacterium]|nr:tetratricopeptide repeat protein [Lewinellaceae bacterium]